MKLCGHKKTPGNKIFQDSEVKLKFNYVIVDWSLPRVVTSDKIEGKKLFSLHNRKVGDT